MNEEHDGTDQRKPSEEEYQRFRKMIDGVGREGLQRMVEHLTERIEANPRDTEALGGRGLAYAELGDHRLAAADNGRIIALEPDNAGAYLDRARAYSAMEEHRLAVADYAAGIIVVLSKRKPEARKGKIVLVNASRRVGKARPKNYIPEEDIRPIAAAFLKGEAVEG